MSSADSSLLAASSLLVNNIILPVRPGIHDRTLLLITRATTVLLLILATFLAMKVESIYVLMTSCWSSQLVVVLIPVLAAIYCPKASSNTIWCTMIVSTAVWMTYMFLTGMDIPGSLPEKMASGSFKFQLTNGAVFGFAAGLIAFFASFTGERISRKIRDDDEKRSRRKKDKKRHKKSFAAEYTLSANEVK
jgi:Na+/proline symporter